MEYINITRLSGKQFSVQLSDQAKRACERRDLQIIESEHYKKPWIFGIQIKNNTGMVISVAGRNSHKDAFTVLRDVYPGETYFPKMFQQKQPIVFK